MKIKNFYLANGEKYIDELVLILKKKYSSISVFKPLGKHHNAVISYKEAKKLLVDGEDFKLYKNIIKRFKELQNSNDLVICLGIDKNKLGLDIDMELSKNLGTIYSNVLEDNDDVIDTVKLELKNIKKSGCTHFVTFVPDSNKDFSTLKHKVLSSFYAIGEHLEDNYKLPITPCMFEYELFKKAKEKQKHIVLPESEDDRILKASSELLEEDIAKITLLGNKEKIKQKSKDLGLNLSKVNIIDPQNSKLSAEFTKEFFKLRESKGISLEEAQETMKDKNYFATMMVHLDYADGMVSGAIGTTADTIRPALQIIKTKPNISIVSSIFLMCLDTEVFAFGDCAVNPEPNSEHLAQIALTSAQTASLFGLNPKVAMLSYSTGSSGKGQSVEKVKQSLDIIKKENNSLRVDGPLQFDAAIDKTVANKKMPNSEVAGEANIFIFPDLNSGNIGYKAVQRTANAVAIGPILQGLKKPINDLSRGCLVKDIVNTIAITAIQGE